MQGKVRKLAAVVRGVPDGAEVALGGFDADVLVGAGTVKRFSYGGGSLAKFGRLGRINESIEDVRGIRP